MSTPDDSGARPRRPIAISVQTGDVTSFRADVLALPLASTLASIDRIMAAVLRVGEDEIARQLPEVGSTMLVGAHGKLAATQVLLVRAGDLADAGYRSIRVCSARVLEALARLAPDTARLAVTAPAAEHGLDEGEALRAQLAGYLDALRAGAYPPRLDSIAIVEIQQARTRRLSTQLDAALPPNPLLAPPHAAGPPGAPALDDAGASARKPHILAVLSTDDQPEELLYEGLQAPANAAGYLCERIDPRALHPAAVERIRARVEHAALVVVELSRPGPHHLLAAGYSWGRGRPLLLISSDPQSLLPLSDDPRCLIYRGAHDLAEALLQRLAALASGPQS